MQALILADGSFPENEQRRNLLKASSKIICCDGAVKKLVEFGLEPFAIVGDMDSISDELQDKYSDRIFKSDDQETNDLTKAVEFCIKNGFDEIAILGATGLREDHTLGNISLLADYAISLKSVCLLTDFGRIDSIKAGVSVNDFFETGLDEMAPEVCSTRNGLNTVARFRSFSGQQVSIFSLNTECHISALELKYPLENRCLTSWWQGTLNEAISDEFTISIDKGSLLVYRLNITNR